MKIGDEVVCIDGDWINDCTGESSVGPKKGDILIVNYVNPCGYLMFLEYGDEGYNPSAFIKLNRKTRKEIQYVKQEIKIEEPILN